MDYDLRDSSGTDDDLPPSKFNRIPIAGHFSTLHNDMEAQIHYLEQVAYSSVLRAFKAQSDALTWEKEGLITELRKELRVSDDEHRELLAKVNADDIICRIREWRKTGGVHGAMLNVPQQIHDLVLPSPTVSASRKRQKTAGPLSVLPQPLAGFGAGGNTPRPVPGISSMNSPRYSSIGRTPRSRISTHGSTPFSWVNELVEADARDPLIGRRIMTRWPDDNNFYEALIADYNPLQGRHALVYDNNTHKETFEWVNLKEIPPQDIRWIDEELVLSHQSGRGVQGRGSKNQGSVRSTPTGRGRGTPPNQLEKRFPPASQNDLGLAKDPDEIEIFHTDTLIKEVEKVFDSGNPDLLEIQKAKTMLKEHEQALIDVIAKLADTSDGESDGDQPIAQTQAVETGGGGNQDPSSEVQAMGNATVSDNRQDEFVDIV